MRAGLDFTHLVTFDDGAPDGDILWALYSLGGAEIATGSVTPAVDAVSAIITVGGAHNQLAGESLRSIRELVMSYAVGRSEEHTSELQSLMRISYAVFCLKKHKNHYHKRTNIQK